MTVRRRLARSSVLIALAAVLVLGIPLAVVDAARVHGDVTGKLEREADAIAGIVNDRGPAALTTAKVGPLVRAGHRATVTLGGRTVVAGARLTGSVVGARSGTSRGATVVVAAPSSEVRERVVKSWLLIAGLSAVGVALAFALAVAQARRLSRPLEVVAAGSARLGEGDFSVRVPDSGVPEIDAIAHALGRSAERIARMVGREREFSSNVSHQLRTPLTALRLRLEEAERDEDRAQVAAELVAAVREADRLEATVAQLLAYARAESEGRRVAVALDAVVAQHVVAWRAVAARAGREVELVVSDGGPQVAASPGTVGQVLDVLLENALRHGAGTVRVQVSGEPGWGTVTVEDQGDGIAHGDRARVFERGVGDAGGTGIGLHLARALAVSDGGTLTLTRDAPARFQLRLRAFAKS